VPLKIDVASSRPMALEEFCDLLDADLDSADGASILPLQAHRLASLMLDRRLVVDAVIADLRALALAGDGSRPNAFSGQSILLARRSRFVVRANIWTPRSTERAVAYEEEFAAYQIAHNHPVDFLTGGFWGGGYETVLHHYTPAREALVPRTGERVSLEYIGRERLTVGTVMHYDAVHDVHHQEHAEDLSISINVIVRSPSTRTNRQLLFDTQKGCVVGAADVNEEAQQGLVEIAELLLGRSHADIFERIAVTHSVPGVRVAALRALAGIEPSRRCELNLLAHRDEHLAVRACLSEDEHDAAS
jgi:hypothetical protein